jgi:polyisoprenoid-binding protein YceI
MTTETHPLTRTADGKLVPASGTWQIDPAHTSVEFVARHLMVTKVRGRFSDVSGTIEVADNPLDSAVSVTTQIASVTTGAADRDGHVVSPDFFDVDNHPEMTFVSTGVRSNGDAWTLDGDLTIKGVTKPMAFDFDFVGVIDDPYGNSKAAFAASAEIMREDWGLTWNVSLEAGGVLVSKKIAIEIEIQAVLAS